MQAGARTFQTPEQTQTGGGGEDAIAPVDLKMFMHMGFSGGGG